MELWVRDKSKTILQKVERVEYNHRNGLYSVMVGLDSIGTYATKERCLEIIDEIQKLLMSNLDDYIVFKECEVPQETLKSFMETKKLVVTSGQNSPQASVEITPCNLRVYEMPQE